MRANQRQLVNAVLAGLRGRPVAAPSLTFAEFRIAGLATGLTALFGELFAGSVTLDELDPQDRVPNAVADEFGALHAAVAPDQFA